MKLKFDPQLLPLFFIIFIDTLGYFLVFPVFVRVILHNEGNLFAANWSAASRDFLFGIAVMLSPLAFLIASPYAGNLSDRFGRKKVLLFCLSFGVLGFLLPILGIAKKILSLVFLGRFIAGVSTASQPVAQAAIADFSEGRNKAFYLALIGFAMTLAMVLGPIGGGYISDAHLLKGFGLSTPYWLAVFLSLLNIILLLAYFHEKGQVIYRPEKITLKEHLRKIIKMLVENKLIAIMAVFFLIELAWSQYYQTLYLFLANYYHYSANQIGLFTGFSGLLMSLGLTFIYKYWLRFQTVHKILKISLLISALGFLGSLLIFNPIFQWIFIIPIAISIGTAYPSALALMSDSAPIDHQGLVLGVASTMLGLAWMMTGFFAGSLSALAPILPILLSCIFILGACYIFSFVRCKKAGFSS